MPSGNVTRIAGDPDPMTLGHRERRATLQGMPADTTAPLAVLGTHWTECEQWETKWRGFLRMRPEFVPAPPLRYLDWTIDGVPLRDRLTLADGAECPDITFMTEGGEGDPFVIESLRALLLESESGFDPWVQFTDGRAGIYFCAGCGDLACGAVSADVRYTETTVEWRDIAYQGGGISDDGMTEAVNVEEVPSFSITFDRAQYEGTVRALLAEWGDQA